MTMGRAGKPPASVQLTSWEAMDALFGQRPGRVHRWDREGGGEQKVAERPTVMVTEGCDGVRGPRVPAHSFHPKSHIDWGGVRGWEDLDQASGTGRGSDLGSFAASPLSTWGRGGDLMETLLWVGQPGKRQLILWAWPVTSARK